MTAPWTSPREPLALTIELARSQKADDPYDFRFAPQEYILREAGGIYGRATFPWEGEVLAALDEVNNPERQQPDAGRMRGIGEQLRTFLDLCLAKVGGWGRYEEAILGAARDGRPVHLTLRFAAAELYALPWELLALKASGQHLGALPGCSILYEWPGPLTAPMQPSPPPEQGRLLFAWAGDDVPHQKHLSALREACHQSDYPFDVHADCLPHVTLAALEKALASAAKTSRPVVALHLLCHGARRGDTWGLRWHALTPDGGSGPKEFIDSAALTRVLAPHAGSLRLVVLCACHGADPGKLDNRLGSVAQTLHRAGIEAVVASRRLLTFGNSVELTSVLYSGLLDRLDALPEALAAARKRLQMRAGLDWASVQLYAQTGQTRPFVVRPYRALEPFDERHRRFFFGRDSLAESLTKRVEEAAAGKRPRFQVVTGASGSGKSSLVLAGLVPGLPAQTWDWVKLRPGDGAVGAVPSPLAILHRKLRHLRESAASLMIPITAKDMLEEASRLRSAKPARKLLVLVDQLEEAFTRLEAEPRQELFRALWALASDEALGVVVLATMRVDYFERCGEVLVDGEGKRLDTVVYSADHHFFVPQMTPQEIKEAIEHPAQRVGLQFEPGLAERLEQDVGAEPGALPMLEYALDLLWEHRQERRLFHRAYSDMGKVTGALTRVADELYDGLSGRQQEQARRLLVKLVGQGHWDGTTLNSRQQVWLAEVRPASEAARRDFDGVLEKLVKKRLLVRGGDGGDREAGADNEDRLEIAHEALIRSWKRLAEWVEQHRQAEKVRRQRRIFASLTAAALIFGVLAAFAWTQRNQARHRLEQAVKVTETVNFIVYRKMQNLGEAAAIRKELLDEVRKLLRSLGAPDDAGVLRNEMVAHQQLGDEYRSHDNLVLARKEYEASLQIAERLASEDEGNALYQDDRSVIFDRLGSVAEAEGRLADAHAHYQNALAIRKALADANPSNTARRADLAVSYNRLGSVAQAEGRLADARTSFEQDLKLTKFLADADPSNASLQRALSATYVKLGDVAHTEGKLAEARDTFQKAFELAKSLADVNPSNASFQRDFSVCFEKLGNVAVDENKLGDARVAFEKSLELRKRLLDADPSNASLRRDLSVSYNKLGDVAKTERRLGDARAAFQQAREIVEALVKADASNASLVRDLSISFVKLGDVAQAENKLADAHTAYQKALELTRSLADADRSNASLLRDLSVSYNKVGGVALAQSNFTEARAAFEKAIELRTALVNADPSNASLRRDLAVGYHKLGDVAQAEGKLAEARASFHKDIEITQRLIDADLSNASNRRDLVAGYIKLGDVEQSDGKPAEARVAFEKAIERVQALVKDNPSNPSLRRDLVACYNRLGRLAQREGKLADARAAFRKDLEVTQALVDTDPSNDTFRRDLSGSFEQLGDVAHAEKKWAEAQAAYQKSLRLRLALADADPSNLSRIGDLALSFEKLGETAMNAGQPGYAREAYKKALGFRKLLAEAEPASPSHRQALLAAYQRLGSAAEAEGKFGNARTAFEESLALIESLAAATPSNAQLQRDLARTHGLLAELAKNSKDRAALSAHRTTALSILDRLEKDGQAVGVAEHVQLRNALTALGNSPNAGPPPEHRR